ncbi:MAG: helix-turn-helix domain-containing protein [Clostridia bacterium]|nr:helix-turn-helix domain-containing protein [Clostridia bacterium]
MFENIPKIGQRIRFFRMMKGISQTRLSRIAGKSHTYINRVENGTKRPSAAIIAKLCEYFEISIKDFFDFDIDAVEKAGLLDVIDETNNLNTRKEILKERFRELCKNKDIMYI